MQKVVRVTSRKASIRHGGDDLRYWLSRPVEERIAAVERLRQQYVEEHFDAEPGLQKFIESLNAQGVEYLVVGGYALAAHGHPRYTVDLDVWVNPLPANLVRLMKALDEFGFGSLGLAVGDFAAPDTVVQLGYPPGRIDLLTGIDGAEFDKCFVRRQLVRVGSVDLPIIHVEDFKTNKRAVGRYKDLADLEALEGGEG